MPNPFSDHEGRIVSENVPVFAPKRIQQMTLGVEWTPSDNDIAFYPGTATTFTLGAGDSSSIYIDLPAGQAMGIKPGITFTFSTSVVIAVM